MAASLLDRIGPHAPVASGSSLSINNSDTSNTRNRPPRKRKRGQHNTDEGGQVWLTPWVNNIGMTEYESVTQRLHDEITAFVTYVGLTSQEEYMREQVRALVHRILRNRFRRSEVNVFGSAAQGLSLPGGDVDIVLSLPHADSRSELKTSLFQLAAMLKRTGVASDVEVRHQARIPIISFQTVPELCTLRFDIGVNNEDGLKALPIVEKYMQDHPVLKPLMLVLKSFLSRRGLSSASNGGINSFVLLCMVVSFIQLNPLNRPREDFTDFMQRETLGVLLLGFFEYYGSRFPYLTSYISITEGRLLPKPSAPWISHPTTDRLVIQSPLDPERDCAKAASRIEQVKEAFREAKGILERITLPLRSNNHLGLIIGLKQEVTASLFLR
ncbi:Nucleotidyltransferase [Coniophora puteana RWD-64-598 SS2]|uniref:polynucleotide adenylyltransferase n=1 Tax=Coniophora puteana (strain RWD-64-598) TaxID=741705 RepID=A0A5M3N7A7_CONPW|nr:Nucleotidyltransferase [Coniophora puteana RWD-64-598 SS2]EIW87329.1 Nucleotidyltransferase [Coniophora puteana RWD-64-598 SS2]